MILTIILLGVYGILMTWISISQVRRCSKLENIVNNVLTTFNNISDTIGKSNEILNSEKVRIAFENDDEVGSFFNFMKTVQQDLNSFKLENTDVEKTSKR